MEKLAENDVTYFYLSHVVIIVTAVTMISLTPVLDGMSLDVSVLSKKNNLKRYNKCLIFISLIWDCKTDDLRPQGLKNNTFIS